MKSLSKLLFLIFPFTQLFSQQYDLEQCINLALENNIEIKMQKLNSDNLKLQLKQSKYNLLPNISLGNSVNYNIGYSINPLDYSYTTQNSISGSISLSSQILLFQGFQQLNTIQKNKIDLETNSFIVSVLENNLKLQIIDLFAKIVLDKEVYLFAKKQHRSLLDIYQKKLETYKYGLISEGELKDIKYQIIIDSMNIIKLLSQLEYSLNRMNNNLHLPINNSFDIRYNILNHTESPEIYANIEQKNFSNNPEMIVEHLKLKSFKKQTQIYKGMLFPSVTFGYNVGSNFINTKKNYVSKTIFNPIIGYVSDSQKTIVRSVGNQNYIISESDVSVFSQYNNNIQHQFQINFQWQFFNKNLKRSNIKISELSQKQQELKIQFTKQKLKESYYQVFNEYKITYEKYQSNLLILNSNKDRFIIAKQKYENSLIDFFQFSVYLEQLKNAELELLKSKIEKYYNLQLLKLIDDNETFIK